MIYGIPNFKLEKEVVLRRWQQYEEGGIQFHLNCAVGRTSRWTSCARKHDAVLIATGVYKARDIDCPGAGLRWRRAGARLPDRVQPQGPGR